jgi:AraC-like DNA-binding protein
MRKGVNRITFEQYDDCEIVVGSCWHTFPPHIHKRLCAGVITGGMARLDLGLKSNVLYPGDTYAIPPYTLHSLSPASKDTSFGYRTVCYPPSPCPAASNGFVSEALEHIEESNGFALDRLANAVHVSKYHLNRCFKEQIGITPNQLFQWKRVKKVRLGLQAGASLSDLAYDLGYADESHLCNTFKKYVGITPLQYIKSHKDLRQETV